MSNPPRIDGGEMQRRRRGLSNSSDSSTSRGFENVLSFPKKDRTTVRPEEVLEEPWSAGEDDGQSSADLASMAGAVVPRSEIRSPKRTERGPNPIGVLMPTLALPKALSGYRPQDVGLVTHAAIAVLAPHAQSLTSVDLAERVLDVTGALVNGQNVNRRRVLMLTAAGHVATYLRRFAPSLPWVLVGAEFDTGGGRTDVAWRNSETGVVFFDEIKTHNRAVSSLGSEAVAQAKRQGEGGRAVYGDLFVGVRVIPLGALHLTALVHPDRKRMLLDVAPDEPLRLRAAGGLS